MYYCPPHCPYHSLPRNSTFPSCFYPKPPTSASDYGRRSLQLSRESFPPVFSPSFFLLLSQKHGRSACDSGSKAYSALSSVPRRKRDPSPAHR